MKEIKDDTDGEIYHVLKTGRINIVKMNILPKAIYRLNSNFFLNKKISKFISRHKTPQISKALL